MSTTAVLADHDIVSDFMHVLADHCHLHTAEQQEDGRWKVRRTGTAPVEVLAGDQVEELVMEHLIAAFAAHGLADDSLDF
ncbi:hypothetical protein ACFVUH_08165 [Kitasatospora sp. NPDC058032]|uniref:hypothetical protein n=1 Tax=Kitasatospora sp. NPDC058032 TaxID=3346307 RepID=UPI0036DD83D8